MCDWFFNCQRPATGTRYGPTPGGAEMYGDVPVCDSCAAFVDSGEDRLFDGPREVYDRSKVSGDELAPTYTDAGGYDDEP